MSSCIHYPGTAVADGAFWGFSVGLPLAGVLANGVCILKSRVRLGYVLLGWVCLLLAAIGLFAVGIGSM